jgi:hypothetical protein
VFLWEKVPILSEYINDSIKVLILYTITVSKELLGALQSNKASLPAVPDAQNARTWNLDNIASQLNLFRLREQLLVKEVLTL